MTADPKRIGVFGGTFNPVHNGHLSIARSFLESGVIDELWVLLNPSPPHKKGEVFAPFDSRMQMLRSAFEPIRRVRVSDLEKDLPAPAYTVSTLKYLTKTHPEHTYYLCIGKDSFLSFDSWHRWQTILDNCSLLVAERPTEGTETADPRVLEHTYFVDHTPVAISSTNIRDRISRGDDISSLVPKSVAQIIYDEELYR